MRLRCAIVTCGLLLAAGLGRTQDASDPVQALVEQERIRALVEAGFARAVESRVQYSDATAFVEAYTDIAYELGTADAGVIPLLANETLQADPSTFYLAAYALAFHGTAESLDALHAALEQADEEQTAYAASRKAHLIWALAAAGDVRAIRLADQGRHLVGDKGVYRIMTVLEAATILTSPGSLEILHEELSRESLPPAAADRRTMYSIRALGNIGDPSSLPVFLSLIKSDDVRTRIEATKALAHYPERASIDALFEALDDSSETVSGYSAYSLLLLRPEDEFARLSGKLATLKSQPGRKALYKLLARLDPEVAIPLLKHYTASPDPVERRNIYEAAKEIRSPLVLDLLVHGLADPAGGVGIAVVQTLAGIDNARARRLLVRAIESPSWPVAQTASRLAAEARIEGAAETIRNRLLNVELPGLVHNSSEKLKAEWLLARTIELEDLKALGGLEKALEVQRDGLLVKKIEVAVGQLRAAREAGQDLEKWEVLAFHADAKIRETAYRHLSRVREQDAAASILASAFGRVEPTESSVILERLAELDTTQARDVVERVLTAPEYQRPELYALRDTAAWAARRLGGERMRVALRRSIEIRHGRDVRPIIYYTLLSGKQAIPLIEEWIVPRMRFSATSRGSEYRHLRELLTTLRLGHEIDDTDRPPAELVFR